jgi:hypothetical protein
MLKLVLACHKHPGYNPSKGPNAIKGGCEFCQRLLEIGRQVATLKRNGANGTWKAAGTELHIPLVLTYRSKAQNVSERHEDEAQPMLFPIETIPIARPIEREILEPKPRRERRKAAKV